MKIWIVKDEETGEVLGQYDEELEVEEIYETHRWEPNHFTMELVEVENV